MKKMVIFFAIIMVLFISVAFLTNLQNEEKVSEKNPYEKESLHPETVSQLDDPNYQNLILPEKLEDKINKKEDVTVYFYSPTCSHCKRTTPVVGPLAEEMEIDLVQFNLLEFESGWDDYGVESTPTIIQYKDGKETARIVGYQEEDIFEEWFNANSK